MSNRLLKAAVSLLLFGVILWKVDLGETLGLIGSLDIASVGGVLVLALIGILISTWKWSMLLRVIRLSVSFMQLLRLFWIGVFFNNLLPGRTGGDLIRAYGVGQDARNRTKAFLSVAIDRGLNLMALFGIAILALLISPGLLPDLLRARLLTWSAGLCAGALLVLGVGFYLSRRIGGRTRIGDLLAELSTVGARLLRRPAVCLTAVALSVGYQATVILSNFTIARGLGLEVTPGVFFYLIPITALITLLPISLNGLGLREGAYALVFTQIGVTAEAAVAISIAATACMVGISLVGGILYITGPTRMQIQPEASAARDTASLTLVPQGTEAAATTRSA